MIYGFICLGIEVVIIFVNVMCWIGDCIQFVENLVVIDVV